MRLSYSNVMATIAVFIALGGTGVAAVSLSRNSVGSKQIKRGAVKTSELHRNAVRSSKVKNGSLLAKDFALGQLPSGPKGDTGPTGPVGPTFGGVSGETPPATLQGGGSALQTEVDLPAAGDLVIFARSEPARASCSGNPGGSPCTIAMGIYVDGHPVPGSGLRYGPDVDQQVPAPTPDLFGRMPNVSAGHHQIAVYFTSPDGFANLAGGAGFGSIGWVLLGGSH